MEPMTPMDNPGLIKRRARQGPGVAWGDLLTGIKDEKGRVKKSNLEGKKKMRS